MERIPGVEPQAVMFVPFGDGASLKATGMIAQGSALGMNGV